MSHAYCVFCFTKIHPNGRHRTKFNQVCLHFFNLRETQLLGLFIKKINHTSTHSSCYAYKKTRLTIQRVLDKQNNSFRESVFLFIAQTIWCEIKTDWLGIFFNYQNIGQMNPRHMSVIVRRNTNFIVISHFCLDLNVVSSRLQVFIAQLRAMDYIICSVLE